MSVVRNKMTFTHFRDTGLFNLRGADIEYNPVFFSYALVTMEDIR